MSNDEQQSSPDQFLTADQRFQMEDMEMPMPSHDTPHDEENIDLTATLGTVITGGRDHLGITQREAADHIGIDETYLSKLEHDESKPPSDRVLTAFAHLYEIDDDLLYCLSGKVPPDLRQDVTSYGVVKRLRVMIVRSLLTEEAAEIWPLAMLNEAQS